MGSTPGAEGETVEVSRALRPVGVASGRNRPVPLHRADDPAGPSAWLRGALERGGGGLGSLYAVLDAAAVRFGVDIAVVLDTPELGRQAFHAGRAPHTDELTFAEPGLYAADPGLDPADAAALLQACGFACRELGPSPRPVAARAVLDAAVARAARHRWPFTLAVVRAHDEAGAGALADAMQAVLRGADEVVRGATGPAGATGATGVTGLTGTAEAPVEELLVIFPAIRPDHAVLALHRVAQSVVSGRTCPVFSFGLASCPGESSDAGELLVLARSRCG